MDASLGSTSFSRNKGTVAECCMYMTCTKQGAYTNLEDWLPLVEKCMLVNKRALTCELGDVFVQHIRRNPRHLWFLAGVHLHPGAGCGGSKPSRTAPYASSKLLLGEPEVFPGQHNLSPQQGVLHSQSGPEHLCRVEWSSDAAVASAVCSPHEGEAVSNSFWITARR